MSFGVCLHRVEDGGENDLRVTRGGIQSRMAVRLHPGQ
jgi:hypothetical protein